MRSCQISKGFLNESLDLLGIVVSGEFSDDFSIEDGKHGGKSIDAKFGVLVLQAELNQPDLVAVFVEIEVCESDLALSGENALAQEWSHEFAGQLELGIDLIEDRTLAVEDFLFKVGVVNLDETLLKEFEGLWGQDTFHLIDECLSQGLGVSEQAVISNSLIFLAFFLFDQFSQLLFSNLDSCWHDCVTNSHTRCCRRCRCRIARS